MSIQHKRLVALAGVGLLVSMLGACKELEDLTTELSKEPENSEIQVPGDDGHNHGGHISSPDYMTRNSTTLNLAGIKINGLPVAVSLASVPDPWGVSNNTPAILDSSEINKVEFDFSNTPVVDSMVYRMEFRLRSMVDEKYFNVSLNQLGVMNGQLTLLPETGMDVMYEDMKNGVHNYGYYENSSGTVANMVDITQFKMTLDILTLMSNVSNSYPDKYFPIPVDMTTTSASTCIDVGQGVVECTATGTASQVAHGHEPVAMLSTDSAVNPAQFFSNDLYSLSFYYDGELNFKGNTIHQLSNCVFASADTPPADISDICQAYLTVYK